MILAWLLGILGAGAFLGSLLHDAHHFNQWMEYAKEHCSINSKTQGRFPLESDQTCWTCDDGVIHCR